MPELPEIETICIALKKEILGKKITQAIALRTNLRIDIPKDFSEKLTSKIITDIKRRSKYIQIYLEDIVLIVHLGMSGRFISYINKRDKIIKHDHVIIDLDNGYELVLNDPRRFGLVTIAPVNNINSHPLFLKLGIEPLTDELTPEYLQDKFKKRNTPVKSILMDNKILVGVGNIYASESLFRSNISPNRPACSITYSELKKLSLAVKETLNDAIEAGGSSLKDYVNLSGDPGYFQNKFFVYGKNNQNCIVCLASIIKTKHSGRATYFCSTCQK
ncbi:MAG: bifunctional DNA-formamidopyrimidine glycosylase/DNA-(apurinic or apyrimidinic site) lyase [Alphaproteobacteria bacterium]